MINNYWLNITKIFKKQQSKGIAEYGQTLQQNTSLTTLETLEMLQEELVDGLMYLEKLKEQIKKGAN